uniref:Rubisco LSMT substrate-binding domain-containing protein n=1 Tax=Ananas comosus var. bracteatus TaxID=296719 RepID=A0A6V7QAW4_ANACO|nr:unnamed protein product [Ananas comosus var. bracteatus]
MATKKETERSGVVTLSLPILSEEDPLFPEKMRLSNVRNLSYNFDFPVSSSKSGMLKTLDQMVQTARLLYMHELELYFAEDDDFGPFSSRNELESLNSVLNIIHSVLATASVDAIQVLQVLETATIGMIKSLGMENKVEMIAMNFNGDAEDSLLKWGESHGVKTKLKVAFFEGAGRGTVASEDLSIGVVALEVPESLIISEDLVYGSDVFDVLKDLDDITSETMLLLWSMRERYNPSSKFRIYFETLPEEFNTGLRFAIDALAALDGTLLFEELTQAKEHLRQQYDMLFPALSMKYPDLFKPELYTWEKYLWACELWYSNSMKVVLTDGKLKTCLIPIAGLLNHSLCPHILHYGRLRKPVWITSCHLLWFPSKGDNPYDIIPIDFDTSNVENDSSTLEETSKITHMVRGTWFSKSDQPYTYDLPSRLLTHLRAVLNCQNAESPAEISRIDICENDRMVLETVLSIFSPMLEGLGNSDDFDRVNASWDLKLALGYKDLQRRIISSIVTSCTSGLEMLEH